MHSSALGITDRMVFRSLSSARRRSPVKVARYSSMVSNLGSMRTTFPAGRVNTEPFSSVYPLDWPDASRWARHLPSAEGDLSAPCPHLPLLFTDLILLF